MQNKCKFCIHAHVCKYQDKFEEIERIYIPIKNKAVEYDVFECEIKCKEYRPNYGTTKEVCDDTNDLS